VFIESLFTVKQEYYLVGHNICQTLFGLTFVKGWHLACLVMIWGKTNAIWFEENHMTKGPQLVQYCRVWNIYRI
jgi:hypothetical protein